ncbi:DEAD/DEAH box helicase [Spirochaeta thermophila]|uniref:ATP-dependent RNA helicase RhlB n=1 Tax=Winmispira thermophila (strain ATCC 49972 / DSM 6192 / RI 19.B1) TaxID=665571 RepID=E0RT60_WINT6|nr:DEAD/DEAH box helicase [Spirochaeta thermophila]ADN02356.1 ATP-dependent RNA helicase RhlB [Spirochaeta thermophila DSM 6192]
MQYEELGLHQYIARPLSQSGYLEPWPALIHLMERYRERRDALFDAQYLHARVAAYVSMAYQSLLEHTDKKALILVPIHELENLVHHEAGVIGRYLEYRCGIAGRSEVTRAPERYQLLVGVPRTVRSMMERGQIDPASLTCLVVDETHRMLLDDNLYEVLDLLRPHRSERLTYFFSSALSLEMRNLVWKYADHPEEVRPRPSSSILSGVEERVYHLAGHRKLKALEALLRRFPAHDTIVFTGGDEVSQQVAGALLIGGIKNYCVTGDMPRHRGFLLGEPLGASGRVVVVTSESTSRNLHVPAFSMVVNYQMPVSGDSYLYRIRFLEEGAGPLCVSLVSEADAYDYLETELDMERHFPSFPLDELLDGSLRARERRQRGGSGRKRERRRRPPRGRRAEGAQGKGGERRVKREEIVSSRPPLRGKSLEERVAYYQRKYGERF